MFNHTEYIESKLKTAISKRGIKEIAVNLNNYFSFDDANEYAAQYVTNFDKKYSKDIARQEKSSKDSVLGRVVEEVIIYLLVSYFNTIKCNYVITNDKHFDATTQLITNSLCIKRKRSGHVKQFDSDIVIYNKDNFDKTRKIFIISAKGTTRERIGQFLSHLFLMDKDVLNAKYGKDKYEVTFEKENIKLKYAFVTLDWAKSKDFVKYTQTGNERKTVKATEVQLILDDVKLGGGIYVLNNEENIDGIGNFLTLAGKICDFLK